MTSSLLRPRGRSRALTTDRAESAGRAVTGSTAPTRILDLRHPLIAELARRIEMPTAPGVTAGPAGQLAALRRAHRLIATAVRPVYSVQDERPASKVLRLGRGSCSQRLAVLESVARAAGVPTRVRGLLVDGVFWHPRFPRLHQLVPDRILLAWPEFHLPGLSPLGHPTAPWLPVSELFGGLDELGERPGGRFTNSGAETLFDALARTAVDWDGATACPAAGPGSTCDLSAYVLADLGHHDSRDDLFARHGQALCGAARLIAEPVLGRWSAGA
ncbi:transglutaminase family protein [Kitasatospora sp. NBC_00240]|uniref:transglutaminase family protein n=1 Tax=Kitasatospora sp. NBC_00240 TaxID=2903567 RepID=UPI0022591CFC|nr:transglutaminase family protein [Kitasatospora sp. NBC_00240]MCX5211223.1 transglutaminase family protein [Kitasatospora sp. NBC_00240]